MPNGRKRCEWIWNCLCRSRGDCRCGSMSLSSWMVKVQPSRCAKGLFLRYTFAASGFDRRPMTYATDARDKSSPRSMHSGTRRSGGDKKSLAGPLDGRTLLEALSSQCSLDPHVTPKPDVIETKESKASNSIDIKPLSSLMPQLPQRSNGGVEDRCSRRAFEWSESKNKEITGMHLHVDN